MYLPICWLLGHHKRRSYRFSDYSSNFGQADIGYYHCLRCHCVIREQLSRQTFPPMFHFRRFGRAKSDEAE